MEQNILERALANESLTKKLWSFAMRTLYNRECGIIESADVCLMNSLYGTDNDTVIKWLNVFMIRNKRVLPINQIQKLQEGSEDIFYSSFIDDLFPNRPIELTDMLKILYEFAQWYEFKPEKPKRETRELYEIKNNFAKKTVTKYLVKRAKPYVISHYIIKVKTQPENFYYSLLLLKQPWRSTDELLNGCKTYQASFMLKKGDLPDAVSYFEKITNREIMLEQMAQNIEDEEQQQQNPHGQNNDIFEDLGYVLEEVEHAIHDFKGNKEQEAEDNFDWRKGVGSMNEDQRRVLDSAFQSVKDGNKICRKFITGETGTEKSYVIKCLVHAIRQELKKDVVILAPTGIAAFN